MSAEPTNRFSGVTLGEWMSSLPDALESDDVVGIREIIPALHRGFGLRQPELELAARQALAVILASGARPVVSNHARDGWEETKEYGDTPDAIINAVIAEWRANDCDPNFNDVWFALPSFYERNDEPRP